VVILLAWAVGWMFLSQERSVQGSIRQPAPAAASAARKPPPPAEKPQRPPTGRVQIDTQPSGARVLLDGKPVGETPLSLETVAPGRHTLTLESTAGTIRKLIRVEAGKTLQVDVPIYSGWVGIFAPVVLEVSTEGRVIGTTEEPRLMLPPGRHTLTLTNKELAYTARETVDIEPGEVRSVTLDPRGVVNVNATPWAEVWIDGRKAGDTPIAKLQLPLGAREIVFRHPQFGERRATVTVRAVGPNAVTVDMTR
jgi:hypothetical protein